MRRDPRDRGRKDKPLPYADPTGDAAVINVLREQMALADAVKHETGQEQRSGVDRLLDELDEEKSAELRAFLADRTVPSTVLARAIAREYGRVPGTSDSQIRRWRVVNP